MTRTLNIDLETYSGADLLKSGVYKYTEHPDFEILMIAFAFDDEPVDIIDLASGFDEIPERLEKALTDPNILKRSANANFERTCLARHTGKPMDPRQWRCTLVDASTVGLPGNLDGIAKALKLDTQKDAAGKALIRYFSIPCKPTKANGGRTRNLPHHDQEKWQMFLDYCVQDVEVERNINKMIEKYMDIGSDSDWNERALWALDQEIVDRGVLIDRELVENAIRIYEEYTGKLKARLKEITGLKNPNSVAQLSEWLNEHDVQVDNLRKDTVSDLLKQDLTPVVREVLEARQELGMSSVKKYMAMLEAICEDDRVRGILQFYGAGRTGRWAGRIIQPQNLPRASIENNEKFKDLAYQTARETLRTGDADWFETLYGNVPYALAALIRTMIIAPEGKVLAVSDFSAIEARVIAWLAGEKWRLEVFATHGKIYEASAAQMFNVPIESIDKGNPLRQKGKVSELALGYQGGPGALIQMGALDMGLTEEELPELVRAWRKANPKIKQLWYDCENAAIEAIHNQEKVRIQHGVSFFYRNRCLYIELPSGRRLVYFNARLEEHKEFDKLSIVYDGIDSMTKQWKKLHTYGGKLVENIIQAIARDCLAYAMLQIAQLKDEGFDFPIVMHVHDEIVAETDEGMLGVMEEVMGQEIPWAKGLVLGADGFETLYYKKD